MDIDYAGLETAFQDSNDYGRSYWLDRETGDVLIVDDWSEGEARKLASPYDTDDATIRLAWCVLWEDGEIESEDPGESAKEQEMVESIMASIIRVPQADTREDYDLMVDFTATVRDPHLCELLELALHGRGAFSRFKRVLARYPDEGAQWFKFKEDDLRQRIDEWLESWGLLEKPD
jgi:hypothetical protein